VKDVRQLKGKIFAISALNGGDHLYSQAVVSHFGIAPTEVTWLPMGTPSSRLSALAAGRVDGTEMTLTNLPTNFRDQVIVSADESPVPFVSNAIFARASLLTQNKPALQRFLAAIGKGADWVKTHPEQAVAVCQESGSDAAACKIAIQVGVASKNKYTWSSNTGVNTTAIQAMIPIVAAVVPQAKAMKVADVVDSSIAAPGP
jgi:NitT/TauT family transport system substrate-binding protein